MPGIAATEHAAQWVGVAGAEDDDRRQPEGLDPQGVRSLEVRWILRGQLPGAVAGWFGRFPVATMALEDAYLLDPHLPGLSVKVRGGRALEVNITVTAPGFWKCQGEPAAASSPGRSGRSRMARPAPAAVTRLAGGW